MEPKQVPFTSPACPHGKEKNRDGFVLSVQENAI